MNSNTLKIPIIALLAVLALAVAASSASAAILQVDSNGDQPDSNPADGTCQTAVSTCTLRAAIETGDAEASADTVRFAAAFDGGSGATIAIGSSLPAITAPLAIEGDAAGQCAAAGLPGPCVTVSGVSAGPSLTIEAPQTTVSGLAVANSSVGIVLGAGAKGTELRDDWVGFAANGAAGPNGTGILGRPGAETAAIGGSTPAARNVVGNSTGTGIELEGTSAFRVSGNYLGVGPGGANAAPNATDVSIASHRPLGPNAVGNVLGGELSAAQAATPACDGPCNVISGAAVGIDLSGAGGSEAAPATGPTSIVANYVGLNAAGSGVIADGTGIRVGEASQVRIGGPDPSAFGNLFDGGAVAISSGPQTVYPTSTGLLVEGNSIGLDPSGNAVLAPPTEFGILDDARGQTGGFDAARLASNRIAMNGGEAIRQRGSGAWIVGNQIGVAKDGRGLPGGVNGIHLDLAQSFASIVEGNLVANASNDGVLIENSNNRVVGNQILSAGVNGVHIQSPAGLDATGNQVGEDAAATEDVISRSGGAAIAIVGSQSTENRVARVSGVGNGGMFIDVGTPGLGTGFYVPVFEHGSYRPLKVIKVTPTAVYGAGVNVGGIVRVYGKAGASPGELQPMLAAQAVQGGSAPGACGCKAEWSVPLPSPLPQGAYVAVGAQEGRLGSSELQIARVDTVAPKTKLRKRPRRRTHSRTARFAFSASESGSKFECKLDRRGFKPCHSPRVYRHLRRGRHLFSVRATDAVGNRAKHPTRWRFRVLR